MSELQWLDQPTHEGWWWYHNGNYMRPVQVAISQDGSLFCESYGMFVTEMVGQWSKVVFPEPPEPQPKFVDCQMVKVKRRNCDEWVMVHALRGSVVLILWPNGDRGVYADCDFRDKFHLPPGFQWPEKMLRL